MHVGELRERLIGEGFSLRCCSLDETPKEETYCLVGTSTGWEVFYLERGVKRSKQEFASESDACEFFYGWLARDPLAKQHTVAKFRDEASARSLVERLERAGLHPELVAVPLAAGLGGTEHRVVVVGLEARGALEGEVLGLLENRRGMQPHW